VFLLITLAANIYNMLIGCNIIIYEDAIHAPVCEISGSQGGEYEDGCLLGCFAV
jgi:hypothetical protein